MSINKNPATGRGLIKSEVFHNSNITLHQPKYQKIALQCVDLQKNVATT
ncbi:uncharacterized protein METZ01_LOCUS400747 [marine metagenome]|uniref:Uncharacterized protein n=1 Tax=marine metagenome TaxID=408172 RepID=A0A382VN14_9ZZZZ